MRGSIRQLLIFILSLFSVLFIVASFTHFAEAQPASPIGPELTTGASVKTVPVVHQKPLASQRDDLIVPQHILRSLPRALRTPYLNTEGWQIIALLLIVSAGLVLRTLLQWFLRGRLAPVVLKFGAKSVGNIVYAFAGPGSTLVVSGLLAALYPGLGLAPLLEAALRIFVRALAILSIVVSLYRIADVLADRMATKAEGTDSKLDDQLVPLLRKAMKILVVLVGALFLLQNLDVNVASLVAGLGIGGVAVALAAKDTIANFFGSLMIFIDRPFQIGDWVKIGETEGIVEVVGFRSTRVRTFYNSLVTVPNARFTEAAIDNLGMREYRRTSTVLNLTYATTPQQMQAFCEGVRAIIVANPYTRKDYYEVHFSGFGAHSLDVMLYFFFRVDSWTTELEQRHNVFIEILRLAKSLAVEFAFPTQTLHLESVAEPRAVQTPAARLTESDLGRAVEAFGPGGSSSRPASSELIEGAFLASTIRKSGGDD
jgi:MscS family membrane protein